MRLDGALAPEWDVDPRMGALMTTRAGGVSKPPFDSLNLGRSAGDEPAAVDENRRRFEAAIGVPTPSPRATHARATASYSGLPVASSGPVTASQPGAPQRAG